MYKVFDSETENWHYKKRFASQFYHKNWVVMRGWKRQDDTRAYLEHFPTKPEKKSYLKIEKDITLLIGHNVKYDLLWEWDNPELQAFFRRGGRIWCTQYAEYLIRAAEPKYHMNAMDDLAEKYGGRKKVDAVKDLWEQGFKTSQIDPDLLADYLIGTKAEKYDSGDIGNTEKIYLGQLEIATKLGMLPMIQARMDGLCCTTEMEWNGLKIDVQEGMRRTKILEDELEKVEAELEASLPEFPPEFKFDWSKKPHISPLIYGGAIKYKKRMPWRDEEGKWVRKKATALWPLVDGVPVAPDQFENEQLQQDVYSSGKKKGERKFKKVAVKGERRLKFHWFYIDLPGYAVPKPDWAMKLVDARGFPLYGTDEETIEEVALTTDEPFLKQYLKRQNILKDLSTYYIMYNVKKSKKAGKDIYNGMLTCVMPNEHIIHHNLNHTNTVTTRLTSDKPNLQNIPRSGTSEVKKLFMSRWGKDGEMIEIDYSQLEIVIQGLLSKDKQLIKDLIAKVDFHCKRVAAKFNVTYEQAVKLCKDETGEDFVLWKSRRTGCKEFSFQRAYGAGAAKIALTTGMAVEEIKTMIKLEEAMYPGIIKFNADVESKVKKSSKPFKDFTRGGKIYYKGYYTAPTGTRYSFRTYDAPDWLQDKGIDQNFMPTEMKNYPVQGTGGEVVQIVLGKLWRHFVKMDNYNKRALLCNTVHDCVWADSKKEVTKEVAKDMKRIMEDVPKYLKELYGLECPVPFPVEVETGPNMFNLKVLHL